MIHVHFHNIVTDDNDLTSDFFNYIREIIQNTINEYSNYITIQNINIQLSLTDYPIPSMSTAWYTLSPCLISIMIDKKRKNIVDNIFASELKSCVIHELHHIQRRNTVWYGETFREVLITEWLACLAEIEANPIHNIPYNISNKEEIQTLLFKAKEQNKNYNHAERYYWKWELPNWSWYKLWYYLINDYAKKLKKTARDLVNYKHEIIINDPQFQHYIHNF